MIDGEAMNLLVGEIHAAEAKIISLSPIPTEGVIAVDGKLEDYEKLLPAPRRMTGSFPFCDPHSFIQYVKDNDLGGSSALMTGKPVSNTFECILDFRNKDGKYGWRSHHACLSFITDKDWERVTKDQGKWLAADEFGFWLETVEHLILNEDASTIAKAVRTTKILSTKSYERPVFNESTGSVKVSYEEENQQKGSFTIPEKITFTVRPYLGAPRVELSGILRFRLNQGVLEFSLRYPYIERLTEEAFDQVKGQIETQTGLFCHLLK